MKKLTQKDLKDTFIAIVHPHAGRPLLPIIRRYFRSMKNQVMLHPERYIEIYFEGVLLAVKKPNAKRLEYDAEFTAKFGDSLMEIRQ